MNSIDCTFKINNRFFNYRVGAVIISEGKILMAKNDSSPYFYTVGGRVHLDETSMDAVKRECKEELGLDLEIERMLFIHENIFEDETKGKYHEIAFFYLMKPFNPNLIPEVMFSKDLNLSEYFTWIPIETISDYHLYPLFFKTHLKVLPSEITHIIEIKEHGI